MQLDRRSFMKLFGVGAVVGPSVLAKSSADPVIKALVFPVGPDEYDSTIMAIQKALLESFMLGYIEVTHKAGYPPLL